MEMRPRSPDQRAAAASLPRPLLYGRGGRRAQPPVGEGSAMPSQMRDCSLVVSSYLCVIQSEAKNPDAVLRAAPMTRLTARDLRTRKIRDHIA